MANFTTEDPAVQRHYSDWKGFTRLLAFSGVAAAVILLLMAAFLL
jgi:hypothetical protein